MLCVWDGIHHWTGIQQLKVPMLVEMGALENRVDNSLLFSCHNTEECGVLIKQDSPYISAKNFHCRVLLCYRIICTVPSFPRSVSK
jgi:hypothetical protein